MRSKTRLNFDTTLLAEPADAFFEMSLGFLFSTLREKRNPLLPTAAPSGGQIRPPFLPLPQRCYHTERSLFLTRSTPAPHPRLSLRLSVELAILSLGCRGQPNSQGQHGE